MDIMLTRIYEVIDGNGGVPGLARLLGISANAIYNWKGRKSEPYKKYGDVIAKHYGVSLDWLSGVTNERQPYGKTAELPNCTISCEGANLVPVLGYIPAGYPAVATQEVLGYEPTNVPNPEDYFWLVVHGDSMINAGIQPDDLVLIHHQDFADNGQIVACRVNGDEATLKRFRRQGNNIILMPENPQYQPRIVTQGDFNSGEAGIIGVAIQVTHKL